MSRYDCFCLFIIVNLLFTGAGRPAAADESIIRTEISQEAVRILKIWYPRAVDPEGGGFIPSWSYNWKNRDDHRRGIVTQARHTWSASTAALRFPENNKLKKAANAGFMFLANAMWDTVYGGFYETRDSRGGGEGVDDTKRMYGNAFGIYALCAYYQLTGDEKALNLAIAAFEWLDNHSRDPEYGGYFNQLLRDGTPVHLTGKRLRAWDSGQAGLKDYNSSIHLLEAYTSLYKIWPDSLIHNRLREIFQLIRDRFVTDGGYLHLFFRADWNPISYQDSSESYIRSNFYMDHVSFGHDVETAYLLIEAAEALYLSRDPAFEKKTRLMVDHAMAHGWDSEKGGLYEAAYYFRGDTIPTLIDRCKTWWVQAEALNAFMLMSQRYPDDTRYREYFKKQWSYIKNHIIDHEYGDWFENGTDTDPVIKTRLKGHHWKTTYHHLRALFNCCDALSGPKSPASIEGRND